MAEKRWTRWGLLLGGIALAGGCTDGSAPAGPDPSGRVALAVAPSLLASSGSPSEITIDRIRITVRNAVGGAVIGISATDVDPEAAQWDVSAEVVLPPEGEADVVVLVELIHVVGGVETVEWSGFSSVVRVGAGEPREIRQIRVHRGPPANLGITAIAIEAPSSPVPEGGAWTLGARVTGGGEGTVLFWSSLAPDVATVDAHGIVRGVVPGTAAIVVEAGLAADTAEVTVVPTPVGIVVDPPSAGLRSLGETVVFEATVVDARSDPIPGIEVEWSSGDEAVLEHAGGGSFRAAANGVAPVVAAATVGETILRSSVTVTVAQEVARLTVTPERLTLGAPGESATLAIDARDANGHPVVDPEAGWGSSDPGVASVSPDGVVTATGPGVATITASADGVTATAEVTVEEAGPGPVVTVEVTPGSVVLATPGETAPLAAEALDAGGSAVAGASATWSTDAPAVATVSSTGPLSAVVTAEGPGTATITADVDGVTAASEVTVEHAGTGAVATVQITPADPPVLTAVGATVRLTATAFDAGGDALAGVRFAWSSSNEAVATVDPTGLVTAAGNGSTEVSATAEGTDVTAAVHVVVSQSAHRLAFQGRVRDAVAGRPIPEFRVKLLDARSHAVDGGTGVAVTLTIVEGTGAEGATLSGGTVRTTVGGVAAFDDVVIDLPGTGYRLRASAEGVDPAESNAFDVTAPGGSGGAAPAGR